MLRIIKIALLLCLSTAHCQEAVNNNPAPTSLASLAASADLVVLAQVRDTDYRLQRAIPVSGSAYLQVLIRYKSDGPVDLIEVYEKGLHPNECYFPNPTVMEEGRRYLVFLKTDPEDATRYRGLAQGCALDVLVNDQNRYALRYPVNGIILSDPLHEVALDMSFNDGYALVDESDLVPADRDAMIAAGDIFRHSQGRWKYTRGVPLSRVRELMRIDKLSN